MTNGKKFLGDLTVAEFRNMIFQAVFGKSEEELIAECAAHGITFAPRNGSQAGLTRTALMYLIEAHNIAVNAMLDPSVQPIKYLQVKLNECRIPRDVQVWTWDEDKSAASARG